MITKKHKEIVFKSDKGFTLIELVVVIVIISILGAIAITILIRSRTMAEEITAKHDLNKFVKTQNTYNLEHGNFIGVAGDVVSGDASVASTFSLEGFTPSPQVVITINSVDPLLVVSATHMNTNTVWQYRQDTGQITK
jgi:prepilin-type N-terminal cleavage/methylation domain-containing protein